MTRRITRINSMAQAFERATRQQAQDTTTCTNRRTKRAERMAQQRKQAFVARMNEGKAAKAEQRRVADLRSRIRPVNSAPITKLK